MGMKLVERGENVVKYLREEEKEGVISMVGDWMGGGKKGVGEGRRVGKMGKYVGVEVEGMMRKMSRG